jgi:hypothetical protein
MRRTSYYVIGIHIFFLLWSALWIPSKKAEKKPLQVRMVVQAPPPPPITSIKQEVKKAKAEIPVAQSAPKPQKASNPSPAPVAAKTTTKPTASKKGETTKKTTPAPSGAALQTGQSKSVKKEVIVPENLVRELQESIAKIEQKSHKESPKQVLQAPKWVPQLKIDEGTTGEESIFVSTLIQCLQDALNLPEMGSVKIELVLKNDGSFVQMKILRSESERNKKFLEQELKVIRFPPFSGSLKDEKEHAFVITFCNS